MKVFQYPGNYKVWNLKRYGPKHSEKELFDLYIHVPFYYSKFFHENCVIYFQD